MMVKIKNNSPMRFMILTLILLMVYLIVSIPFKVMEIIPGFTDIRPVAMLHPVYGIFFGIAGCIACAVGNLITDMVGDSLRWSSIAGFIANFVGPLLFCIYWRKLSHKPFHLRNMKNILTHMMVIVVVAVAEALMITPAVALVYPDVDYWLFFLTVILNTSAFPIFLGIPLIIVLQEEVGLKIKLPSGNKAE